MTEISHTEFLEHLRRYGTGVHCELYSNFYTNYALADEKFYCDRGCVINPGEWDADGRHFINVYIHQTSPEADTDGVGAYWLAWANEKAKRYDNPVVWVYLYIVTNGELPPEKDKYYGFRNYVRRGFRVEPDPRVRVLTENDAALVHKVCSTHIEGDTEFGRRLAESMDAFRIDDGNSRIQMLGIFEGAELVGIATRSYEAELDIAWLRDIYIVPDKRRMGFARALVLTALCDRPDAKWHYQVAKGNEPSAALVRSLGFTLEGAGLLISG